jgi:dTMP kinase
MKKGKFIVIEGGEGAGKSTQIKHLQKIYGNNLVVTREPGGSHYAEEIRNIILKSKHAGQANAKTHFGLFWAGRADHIKNTIIPALEAGKIVVSDRFDSSTFAYQIFGQEATELKDMFFIFRDFFLEGCEPDIYIYMDVDIETGLSRRANEQDQINHFDERKLDFHKRMRKGYQEFLTKVPSVIIDANPSFETVTKKLKVEIDKII